MKHICALLVLMHVAPALADLDQHQQQGLDDTKAFLKNSRDRNAFIKTDKKAQDVDQKLEALVGSGAQKEEVYGISADVMDKLTKEANGDPDKMQAILQEASQHPEAFYNKYFDEQSKSRVRGVAGKVEGQPTKLISPK